VSRSTSITIETPDGRTLELRPTETDVPRPLAELLRRGTVPLNTRCGRRGLCDGCLVELVEGRLVHVATGTTATATADRPQLVRGCEYGPVAPTNGVPAPRVRVPQRSVLAYQPQVVTDYVCNVARAHDPLAQRLTVATTSPDALVATAARLHPDLPLHADHEVIARFAGDEPGSLADAAPAPHSSPAVVAHATLDRRVDHWRLTDVSRAAPDHPLIGAAVDIGTTTVVLALVDLSTGRVVSRAAMFNQQMLHGDDVVTRIGLCTSDPSALPQLRSALTHGTLVPLLGDALAQAHALAVDVRCIVLAGNTTMLHLLAGVDPTPLGVAPFAPAFLDHRVIAGRDLFGGAAPYATCHLLPGAAAYVGADLTAGAVASGLLYDPGPSLLVDVGTNGEIILKRGHRLVGCATAAGPAFEGAGLTAGMRAGDGAIAHVAIDADPFDVRVETIGPPGARAVGVCGSGYVDFLAQARAAGLLTPAGRFDGDALPAAAHDRLADVDGHGLGFRLAWGPGRQPVAVTQADVAKLLQAKAAVAAGILTLLRREGLDPTHVRTVYLAGGFGTHLDRRHAIDCGLLPGFAPEQIQPVGNTSLAGALLALTDAGALTEIARVARLIDVIELNLDPEFESTYIDQLALP
jgi:uncharacterized 2Fe-2S/4Fe-4S cluster protein (DUF4445 family)